MRGRQRITQVSTKPYKDYTTITISRFLASAHCYM